MFTFKPNRWIFIVFFTLLVSNSSFSSVRHTLLNPEKSLSDSVKKEIILTQEVVERVQTLRQSDALLEQLIGVVEFYADSALNVDPIKYEFDGPGNPRLKRERRRAMFNIFNMGVTYRLTGDEVYAEKIKENLLAAANFPDWGPSHFLNIGEISTLMGLGFNWIEDYLTEEEKEIIVQGIIQHGLREGIEAYKGNHQNGWWVNNDNNWNQVCNGGLTIAALAVAEHWPDSSAMVIDYAVQSIPNPMQNYSPDGAWFEGPTYWAYGTTYNALMLDALKTAQDDLHGIDQLSYYEDLGKSGLYHIQTAGPTGLYFNYADAKTTLYFSPVLFWLSRQFDQPVYAWFERLLCEKDYGRMLSGDLMKDDTLDRFLALLVIWFSEKGENASYDDLPFDSKFRSTDVTLAAMRDGWNENSVYLAFKAGNNQAAHGHLDAGTFVLDAKSERWAMELGGDSYALPGYFNFNGPRWQYYRLNNKGHNTLVMNDEIQDIYAETEITQFYSSQDYAFGLVNMADAYDEQSYATTRKFEFADREKIIITDEIIPIENNTQIRWGLITGANVELHGHQALLNKNGKQIRLVIHQPENAIFDTLSTHPGNDSEDPNTGTRMLAFFAEGQSGQMTHMEVEIHFKDTILGQTNNQNPNLFSDNQNIDFHCFPNPAKSTVNVNMHLQKHSKVLLEVYDSFGRKIDVIFSDYLHAGNHHFKWGKAKHPNLKPGVYTVVCTTEEQLVNQKIMITP